jgi:formylglycine-generating enzyme required for sulfatase activity
MHFTAQTYVDQVGALVTGTEWTVATLNGLMSSLMASFPRDDVRATTLPTAGLRLTLGQSVDRLDRLLQSYRKWSTQGSQTTLPNGTPPWVTHIQEGLAALKSIVEVRNELVHGGPVIEERAAQFAPSLRASFLELLDACAFLTGFECLVVLETRRVPRSTEADVEVRLVTGSNPIFEARRLRVKDTLEPETAYLVERAAATAYPLFPDIAISKDADRAISRISFGMLESVRRGQASWLPLDLHAGLGQFVDNAEWPGRRTEGSLGYAALTPVDVTTVIDQLTSDSTPTRSGSISETLLPSGYHLVGLLRRNNGSFVVQATRSTEEALCILKSVAPEGMSDLPTVARIEREGDVLRRLKGSPFFATLVDEGRTPTGAPYVATEYLPFGTLAEWVEQSGPMEVSAVLDCLEEMTRGLVEIHGRGLLHRDIALSNVMIKSLHPMRLAYADLGASVGAFDPRMTSLSEQIGTPDFMAPELLDGRGGATVSSDMYSVGAVTVALLTGQTSVRPSAGDLDALNIPDAIVELLEALLSRIPENRPPTSSALLSRILRLREGSPAPVLRPIVAAPRSELGWWASVPGDRFRRLPAGRFLMGGTLFPNETPVHEVTIPEPLLVGSTPITNSLFADFMKATRYRSSSRGFLAHLSSGGGSRGLPDSWRHPDAPVIFVSWRDASEYCLWRSERESLDYRLLSEAEWEYACRAGTRTKYYWGNVFQADRVNSGQRREGPTPVGSYPPNPWGLYDLLGNVWEWTRDRLDVVTKERSLFYSSGFTSGREAPANDGSSVIVSQRVNDAFRVGRGGSWFSNDRNMRPANRRGEFEGSALRAFGFRICVRGVPQSHIEFDPKKKAGS